jgi:SAM-dependent methyltransferase
MPPASFDPATLAFYATEAPVYTARGTDGASRPLERFLGRLTPGCRILELGCGGGRDAALMISQGFDVEPTDGVAEIAAQAEARLGRPVRVMRFDQLDAVEAYDAIWASATLLHVPRGGLSAILTRIWHALKPGGWHEASYKGGGREGRDRFDRYFNYPTRAEIKGYYAESAPWEFARIEEGLGGGYDGQQGPWVNVTVRKSFFEGRDA